MFTGLGVPFPDSTYRSVVEGDYRLEWARHKHRAWSLAQHAINVRAEKGIHAEARATHAHTDEVYAVFCGIRQDLLIRLSPAHNGVDFPTM